MVISSIPDMKIETDSTDPVDLEIYSSGLLEWEDEQSLMMCLKSEARIAVSHWIQEKRYVLRLLISAGIFLLSYFVFSLAVRDPIPMIDELLISIALSTVYWIFAKRKDEKANIAILKREALYKAIDETDVTYSNLIGDIEKAYDSFLKLDVMEISDRIASGRIERLDVSEDDGAIFSSFKVIFHKYLTREEKHLYKELEDILSGKKNSIRLAPHLAHAYATGSYDIYLMALAIAIFS